MDSYVKALIDEDTKRKASFVLKCKGKNISEAVREMLEEHAKEFDKKYGKENWYDERRTIS